MENHAFDWIEPEDLALARSRLHGELSERAANLSFEVDAEGRLSMDNQKYRLIGRADVVATSSNPESNSVGGIETIWEIKFVSQLSYHHAIQACAYTYLLKIPHVILYNVRNGEKWEIISRDGQKGLRHMIESVLRLKYTTIGKVSDEEFTETCTGTRLEVSSLI
jgi:hypothetical protein